MKIAIWHANIVSKKIVFGKIIWKKVALQALKYLAQNAKTNGFNDFNVMMFGGEPFLNLPIMEYCFEKGLEIAYQNNLRFTSTIVTNGTIMNDEVKRIINKYKNKIGLQIQLSVDGVKESHDMYRVMRSGKGSFDKIEKNINEFKKLFKEDDRSLSIHGCLNKKTLSYLYESYLFFRETWGFKQIWFMPIHAEDWDDKDVDVYKEQLQKIADYILEKAKQTKSIDEVQFYAPIDKCLLPDQRPSAPCGAGKNYITITAKGEIYPCHHFYYNDPEKTTKIGVYGMGLMSKLEDFVDLMMPI